MMKILTDSRRWLIDNKVWVLMFSFLTLLVVCVFMMTREFVIMRLIP